MGGAPPWAPDTGMATMPDGCLMGTPSSVTEFLVGLLAATLKTPLLRVELLTWAGLVAILDPAAFNFILACCSCLCCCSFLSAIATCSPTGLVILTGATFSRGLFLLSVMYFFMTVPRSVHCLLRAWARVFHFLMVSS